MPDRWLRIRGGTVIGGTGRPPGRTEVVVMNNRCGAGPFPFYTVAPWSLSDSNDLLRDIETLQVQTGQEALSSD